MAVKKKGMDVSAFQGIIDWDKAKKDGIQYAILRAGWGTGSVDKYFKRNAQECARLKIPFGVYWFIYCTNDTQASQNAAACLNTIKGLKLDYPIWCDFEYDSVSYAAKKGVPVDKNTASRWVKIFLDTCKNAGYAVGNYTNLDYYNRYFTTEINAKYDLWFAYWGAATTQCKNAPIWQYTSKGKVNGIVGNVDMDECHKTYPANAPKPVPDVPVNPSNDFYGIPEVYKLVFDPDWYYATYKDIQQAWQQLVANGSYKDTAQNRAWWCYQHFLKFGMEEVYPQQPSATRHGNTKFDVVKYKAAYPDLQKAFGDAAWSPYYYHYMQSGALEIATGKRAKVDLSV